MARSAKKNLTQSRAPVASRAAGRKPRPDAIEREFLRLWLTMSRLREQVLRDFRRPSARRQPRAAPARRKKSRGRAA
jgi:hypothetical protein